MSWKRIGHIFSPGGKLSWMQTHASNPVSYFLGENRYRIYFSSRDERQQSSIGWVEMDIQNPFEILAQSETPILGPGVRGSFDESGVSLGCLYPVNGKLHMYYLGWNLPRSVPFRNSIGLAVGELDGSDFKKYSQGPILDRSIFDPFSISYPWVLKNKNLNESKNENENQFLMWYGSHKTWNDETHEFLHGLTYATSKDGIHWHPSGHTCIDTQDIDYAFSKPCVIQHESGYEMWYAYRGTSYRIGYATSVDGKTWERKDNFGGLDSGTSSWENEMVCYPNVFTHKGKRYMFYNGNKYGKTGFGLAIWE